MARLRGKKESYTLTIGVAGADDHVGVTHLVIMLANYLASKKRCRVAVADLSKSHSIGILQQLYEEEKSEKLHGANQDEFFQIHQVDYYSRIVQEDIVNILQKGYAYVVFDFGKLCTDKKTDEILRCHKRILVGSCCEWQQSSFMAAIQEKKISVNSIAWTYAAFLGTRSIRRMLEKKYHIHICEIPYEEDPFVLHREHFEPLTNMLQEAL